jgi:hypothetical protein
LVAFAEQGDRLRRVDVLLAAAAEDGSTMRIV